MDPKYIVKQDLFEEIVIEAPVEKRTEVFDFLCLNGYHIVVSGPKLFPNKDGVYINADMTIYQVKATRKAGRK